MFAEEHVAHPVLLQGMQLPLMKVKPFEVDHALHKLRHSMHEPLPAR
jgi:hypothetical protein